MDCIPRQLKTVVEHNGWTPADKTTYLIAALNEPTANILHSVPTGTTYEEVTEVLKNCYSDHHLAEAFHAQLRRSVQHTGDSLQEFAATINHLAHRDYFDSTEQHISR
jgi:hypothetical protein